MLGQQRQLTNLEKDVERWAKEGKALELKHSQQELDRLMAEKASLEQKKSEIQQRASNLQMALSNCENEERNLRNNLKLIVNTTERQVVQAQLKELHVALEKFNTQRLVTEIKQLQEKLEACKIKVNAFLFVN